MSKVSIGTFCARLDQIMDPVRTAEWDISGLQLGDPRREVDVVAVCHEVTEAVMSEVFSWSPDLVITYHPLIFHPLTRLVNGRSPGGRAWRLVTAGVGLAVAHTSFDAAAGGTADAMAHAIGIRRPVGFAPLTVPGRVTVSVLVPPDAVEAVAAAMAGAGAGRTSEATACSYRSDGVVELTHTGGGTGGQRMPQTRLEMSAASPAADAIVAAMASAHPWDDPVFDIHQVTSPSGFVGRVGDVEPVTLEELAGRAAAVFGHGGMRVSGDLAQVVDRVAVIPGSGGSFVSQAVAAEAQVLVTGDVSHHTVVAALDRGLAVVDVGHAPSERPGMAALASTVTRAAREGGCRVVDLTGLDPTPWR